LGGGPAASQANWRARSGPHLVRVHQFAISDADPDAAYSASATNVRYTWVRQSDAHPGDAGRYGPL